jgi:hypothetical protein
MASTTRNYTPKRIGMSEEECQRIMCYPYSYICDEYSYYGYQDICRPILVEAESERAEVGDFPKNIQEHFWVREGENDGDDWISCGQLTNGAYFFYTGGCDYTGFDCQGGMTLWVSKKWENIIDHAMTEREYQAYISGKVRSICTVCNDERATMPNSSTGERDICADCYWELDSKWKHQRNTLEGLTSEEIYQKLRKDLGYAQ